MDRFDRSLRFLGNEKFSKLQRSFVVLAGLGAVGSYAAEGLVRGGIGHLRIVDFDTISLSNVNRQLYALESTIGLLKTDVAARRLHDINPDLKLECLPVFADDTTIPRILSGSPDLVIDAIDSLSPKVNLIAAACRQGIPVISSMGAAMRTDPARICSGDLFQSDGCPLARAVRKRLRRQGITGNVGAVWSTEHTNQEFRNPETEDPAEFENYRGRKRNILGSLPTITGIFGLRLAHEAIQMLTDP